VPHDTDCATAPHGCLQNLANPAGVHWVEFTNASRDAALFLMLYWMKHQALSDIGWLVVGWETDIEPTGGSSPTLQQIPDVPAWRHQPNSNRRSDAACSTWILGTLYGKFLPSISED